jgi:isoleucyl-tRNA synthetase
VLYHILNAYLILLTPIIPHTCEEVYKFFNKQNKTKSVLLENWTHKLDVVTDNYNVKKWKAFDELKDLIFAKLEEIRNAKVINKNNEAIIKISFNNEFQFDAINLKYYLNVAKVVIVNSDSKEIIIEVDNAKLIKCERCWNYYEEKEMHDQHICKRCHEVLSELKN